MVTKNGFIQGSIDITKRSFDGNYRGQHLYNIML